MNIVSTNDSLIQEMERAALFARLNGLINDIEQAALTNDIVRVTRTASNIQRLVNRMLQDGQQSQALVAGMTRFASSARRSLRQTADTLDKKRGAAKRDKTRMVAYARADGVVV